MFQSRPRRSHDRTGSDLAPLRVRACRDLCSWNRTPVERDGEPVFACRGCGSQWVPSEQWTPRDSAGSIPEEVLKIVRDEH